LEAHALQVFVFVCTIKEAGLILPNKAPKKESSPLVPPKM